MILLLILCPTFINFLGKQGWHDGVGLGKNNQGISNPIKASLKFDKTGIGHDMAKEFTNNWWDLAYAKASSGIQIEENQDGDTVEIKSKKKNRKRKNKEQKEAKKKLYSGFVKSATLTNGELKEDPNKDDNEEDEDDEIVKIERLSDEDLFKAVGGFTGHK